ncbi:MAG: ATP-binding cassette domain-containing protein, partial [Candidatus Fimimonas sp.]
MKETNNILEFHNVSIDYPLRNYTLRAVSDVTLSIKRGKITALVGESGSGKTTLASSVMHCISSPGKVAEGKILFFDNCGNEQKVIDVTALDEKETRKFVWEKT